MAQRSSVGPRLSARTGASLGLGPQMRQGLRLLALPSADLAEELVAMAAENPLLTVERRESTAPAQPSRKTAYEIATETVAAPISLGAHLRAQLGEMELADDVDRAARAISWSLDDRGFLEASEDEIAQTADALPETVAAALAAVQSCTPVGVGARGLRECLALQLVAQGIDRKVATRAMDVLEDIARKAWRQAARLSGLDIADLRKVGDMLPGLSAAPGAAFTQAAPPIAPDILLDFDASGLPVLHLNPDVLPTLSIDPALRAQIKAAPQRHAALRAYLVNGLAVMRAIQFRGRTLHRVVNRVVVHQIDYLSPLIDGPMRPLTRQTVASELGLHPSTVGRVIADKYLGWRGRTVPLSAFFPAPVGRAGHSAHLVQQRLAQLVALEDPAAVLSDAALVRKLQAEGVDIARRTVAKYRGCLGIAPSHIRKRLKRTRREAP